MFESALKQARKKVEQLRGLVNTGVSNFKGNVQSLANPETRSTWVRGVAATPLPKSFQGASQGFGQFVTNFEQSPLGVPGRFVKGFGENVAKSALLSAEYGRQSQNLAAQRRSQGQSVFRSAFSPDVLGKSLQGMFQGAKTMAQTNLIGKVGIGSTLPAAFSGGVAKLRGQDFSTGAGQGFGEGLGLRTITTFTDPLIEFGAAKQLKGLSPLAKNIFKRSVVGFGNTLEDELISKLEDIKPGLSDRAVSFSIGFLVSTNASDEQWDKLKTSLKQDLTGNERNRINLLVDSLKKEARDKIKGFTSRLKDNKRLISNLEFTSEIGGLNDAQIRLLSDQLSDNSLETAKRRFKTPSEPLTDSVQDYARQVDDLIQKNLSPRQRLDNVVTSKDKLIKKLNFPEKVADKVSIERAGEFLNKGRQYKDYLDPQTTFELKNDFRPTKVNALDYFRTPDRVLNKIGLKTEAKFLRNQYINYKKQLPEELNKINQWAQRVDNDPESNRRIFRYLDGQKGDPLTPEEGRVAEEIKSYLSDWAKRLGLPKDKRVTHYITHIFEKDLLKKEFDQDLEKIITDRVPKSVYDPFLEQRLGKKGYIEDTWRALDAYVKRAARKANIDPALERIEAKSDNFDQASLNYIKRLTHNINLRPSEVDNLVDNLIKQSPVGFKFGQRPTTYLSNKIRQTIYRATLGLNPSSALRNLTQGINTYAKLGEKYTGVGYVQFVKKALSKELDELKETGVLDDNFVQGRDLKRYENLTKKLDDGLFALFEGVEKINRGSAYFGAKQKALDAGKSEQQAIEDALKLVRDTQFTFGLIDTPAAMRGDLVKLFSLFQSYPIKQAEFLGELAKNKDWPGLIRYIGASTVVAMSINKLLGFDFLSKGDFIPFEGVVTGDTKLGSSPFTQTVGELNKAVLNAPDIYGNVSEKGLVGRLGEAAIKQAPVIAPAGVQMKKTYQGLTSYLRGYTQTKTGNVRAPVEQSVPSLVRSAVFGQYSSKTVQESFGRTPFPEKQQEAFKALDKSKQQAFFDQMVYDRQLRKAENSIKSGELKPSKGVTQNTQNYLMAEYAYSQLKAIDKKDLKAREAKFSELEKAGYITPEVEQQINRIIDLKSVPKSVRQMSLYEGEFLAQKMIDDLSGLKKLENREERLKLYQELGLLTPEIETFIIKELDRKKLDE